MIPRMRPIMLCLALAAAPGLAAVAEPSPRLTTDTVEYCSVLARRLESLPNAKQEPSRSLAREGMQLCGNGHVRVGVAKLRRAIRAAQSAN